MGAGRRPSPLPAILFGGPRRAMRAAGNDARADRASYTDCIEVAPRRYSRKVYAAKTRIKSSAGRWQSG